MTSHKLQYNRHGDDSWASKTVILNKIFQIHLHFVFSKIIGKCNI